MRYLKSGEACKVLQICPATLKAWKDGGIIKYKQLTSKKFLYDVDSVFEEEPNKKKGVAVYGRVSSSLQREDLDRQLELLKTYCIKNGSKPTYALSDIASGLNENRSGLNALMELVFKKEITKVVVTYKDRLTRFGFDYFKNIFNKFGVEIEVLDETPETNKSVESELTEDLISIIHHYSMKIYASRRKKLQQIKNILSEGG